MGEEKTFAEQHPKLNLLLGVILLLAMVGISGWIIYSVCDFAIAGITKLIDKVSGLDAVVIVALITGAVSIAGVIISSIIAKVVDYRKSRKEYFTKKREALIDKIDQLSYGEYIEQVAQIHHRMTVVHPFRDGNGRTCRAFSNMLLLKKNVPPIFFTTSSKDNYKDALKEADTTGCYDFLYEIFCKAVLDSYARLTDFMNAKN